jgi:hypothetical protein
LASLTAVGNVGHMRNPLAALLMRSRREEFLARSVIRESRRGRSLADILADPYLANRSTADERARLLEQPEVVRAIGEQTIEDVRRDLSGARPTP